MNQPLHTRLYGLAFAALLTLVTLAGIDTLAAAEGAAPLLAQQLAAPRA